MLKALKVAIFDDVVAARGENFHIPGLEVDVYAHADDATELCQSIEYDWVFMDYAMGAGHHSGSDAIRGLRAAACEATIVAISSDPLANEEMRAAGANESLAKKAHLRSYLVHIGEKHLQASDS